MKRRARSPAPARRAGPNRKKGPTRRARASTATGTRTRASAPPPRGAPAATRRTDARIRQAICERLSRPAENLDISDLVDEQLDVSDVKVSVAGAKVTLEGSVSERRMKPYIEALVDACPGVQDIDNRLRVRR